MLLRREWMQWLHRLQGLVRLFAWWVCRRCVSRARRWQQQGAGQRLLDRAHWPDLPSDGLSRPHLSSWVRKSFEVVAVPRACWPPRLLASSPEYCEVSLGLPVVEGRNIVFVQQDTDEILAVVAVAECGGRGREQALAFYIRNVAAALPLLFAKMSAVLQPLRKQHRGTMYVHGLRSCYDAASPLGYYCARAKDLLPRVDAEYVEVVSAVGRGLSAIEAGIAPAVAEYRQQLAGAIAHPGLVPGLPLDEVSGTSVAVTRGYVSDLHTDATVPGLTETVVWESDPADASAGPWGFVVPLAGFVVRLSSARYKVAVMVPSHHPHGSLPRSTGQHRGLGVALFTKGKLFCRVTNPRGYPTCPGTDDVLVAKSRSAFGAIFRKVCKAKRRGDCVANITQQVMSGAAI